MVDITVNGRQHSVQCGEGEEARLKRLASYLDRRISDLVETHGQIGDARLLVLTGLLVADELSDSYDEIKRLRSALTDSARQSDKQSALLEQAASRIEGIAAGIEAA
jgi:cell division protein ZapA